MTARVLGAPPRPLPAPLTSIELELRALDMVVQWRRCGMVADHVADYLSVSFEHPDVARNVLSTVANELVENAVKFSADKTKAIRIAVRHRGELVELVAENVSEARHVAGLEQLFAELARGDHAATFARRIEAPTRGGLGLLILAKDYSAELGAELVAAANGDTAVTLRVLLSTKELEQ